MLNIKNNEQLGRNNGYKGTFCRYGIYVYNNNHFIRPLIILKNIYSTRGLNQGQLVSEYGVCLMQREFLKLGEKGTLNPGATITFDGAVCPMQKIPHVAKIIWPKHVVQHDHLEKRQVLPYDTKQLIGQIISEDPDRYKFLKYKDLFVNEYKRWKKGSPLAN